MTSKLLTGCAAFAVSLSAATSWAGTQGNTCFWLSALAVGQNDSAQQAETLLVRARQLMEQGQLDEAESYIAKAEKLSSSPLGMFQRGDAVKQARQELEARRAAARGQTEPRTRGFSPFGRKESPKDPFLGRETAAAPVGLPAAGASQPNTTAEARPAWAQPGPATAAPGQDPAQANGAPWAQGALGQGVVPAGGVVNAGGMPPAGTPAPGVRTWYDQAGDRTRNIRASGFDPSPLEPGEQGLGSDDSAIEGLQRIPPTGEGAENDPDVGMRLYQQGAQALREGNRDVALHYYRQALAHQHELDPATRQRLQDHLQMLAVPSQPSRGAEHSLIEGVAVQQQVLARQLSAEVARQQSAARAMTAKEPKRALETLEKTRAMVDGAGELDPVLRDDLMRRVDFSINEVRGHIQRNLGQIELDEQNRAVRGEIERERAVKVEVQEKLALLVDDYNKLMDEQRFAEAEVLAKKAAELDPGNPVVMQLMVQSRTTRRWMEQLEISGAKSDGFYAAMTDVERAGAPFVGPIQYPDAKTWEGLTRGRRKQLEAEGRHGRTPRDIEIERKLQTPVSMKFQQRPLGEVLHFLAKMANVNLYLDQRGLSEEGVTSDTPVTIDLSQEISLKSALKLILEPLGLSYVVKDEVLKITSEQLRHGDVYTVSYSVADLIVPIPNFVPGGNLGMEGALQQAHNRLGYSSPTGFGGPGPLAVVASDHGTKANAMLNPALLAQMNAAGASPTSGSSQPMGFGPGGLGGGAQADFDSLIELITSTIQPQSWDDVGGPGSIAPFDTNLSLVVSQTQEVHEEIVDLLQQLRRLQDLQVTIEVRFITLNDNFFERIGVDFDFDIDNQDVQVDGNDRETLQRGEGAQSAVVGLTPVGQAVADLQFRQGSFNSSLPPFGAFDAATAGTFGFAILSDIEAFFLIEAAQGDTRTNVLQAPKVTLFNGQQAFVSDTSQRPFVTSVIPVVGDFAAAQQPVIVVLSEGTSLTVQAVVSSDRRFVRLTVVPFFSQIGEVEEFTFTGSRTTTKGSASTTDEDDDTSAKEDQESETVEGTTVQLPTFQFITVTTTVSVPDGGTVLLGGIKRLSEGRNERGLPILSKLPYINRLFRNVGIGRETRSLMMMVTPRIIIQEEEEANLGILAQP